MAFSNDYLKSITGFTGQMGDGNHGRHVRLLGDKVKQGDQDAFNRLTRMNEYLGSVGYESAKFDIPQLGEPFDKAKLAQISGYDQSPMYRGFGGTVDTAMGQGRHGNYVFDLLAASRGGDTEATTKLNNMNAYLEKTGQGNAVLDISGASFSDKPVNRELRQATGYTGFFGPDAKEGEKFGDFVQKLSDNKNFDAIAKVNQVLEKYGYGSIPDYAEFYKPKPSQTLADEAVEKGYSGDLTDLDAIGRYLSATGSRSSYIDAYGQVTPTGTLEARRDAPSLAPGTELSLSQYEIKPGELLDTQSYLTDPTKFNTPVAQAATVAAEQQSKTVAGSVSPVTAAETIAQAKIQGAEQQGLSDLVTAQTGTVSTESTVQGQLNSLMAQFEGGQVPAFAAGAIRTAEQRLAARGMGASSMAGAALVQAAMEASIPIAAADAETYRRMSELNLNNRQQAEVLNSQMTLQLDLQNLSNDQQAAVINEQNRVQSIFTDQAAQNSAKQFNAQSDQQNDQFFANLFNSTSQFNAAQQNAISQYNAGQENAMNEFNATLSSNREQFEVKNSIVIDQANATYRRAVNTGNTALQNAENEFNVRNLFNISEAAYANLLQQHRDELAFARQQYQNRDQYFSNLSLASIQHDKNIDQSFIDSMGSLVSTVGTGFLFKNLGII